MAGSLPNIPIRRQRQPTQQQQQPQPPVQTPRYHIDFQDFLDDIDAAYFNPYPADAPYST